MKTFNFTPVIEIIIALMSTLITTFLIPLIRERLSKEKYEKLKIWTQIAVKAAEQLYGSKTGQQKKEFVVSFLLSKGFVFDVDKVNTMIESEVYKLTAHAEAVR